MKNKLLPLILCCLLGSITIFAQNQISGTIIDNSGEPLIGASILIKGTTSGTVTDYDGKYELTLEANQDVLVVSYTGYEDQEITVGNRTTVDITLAESISLIDEVVVVGYGTQKRSKISGGGFYRYRR